VTASEPVPVRVPKTAELVARHIRGQIVRGELREGDALPSEGALMERFRISRPTLREAFRVLEHEGLIVVRRGARGGARVQVPDPDAAARHAGLVLQYRQATLADVFEARTIVEPPAAAMLAARRDRVAISRQLAQAVASERAAAPASWQDPVFHRLVVSLTGNETLTLLTNMLEYISEAAGRESERAKPPSAHQVELAHRAHERLVALIRAGDGAEAERHWRRHLVEVGVVLRRLQGSRATVLDVLDVLGA
jgi:GntR family transcriptional regulator, transcriptional repressor for pyruvate dehydrogenase complex